MTCRKTLLLAAGLLASASLLAGESPSWIRKNALSPDGKTLAFSYNGDIYTVPAAGGTALQVTTNAAYESEPMWSPDGKWLLFTSYREDTKDIFATAPEGGKPRQLTSLPGNETPLAALPDGTVLFSPPNTAQNTEED